MGPLLHIDSPQFIEAINDIIHDCWFNTEDITFDASASRLDVPFEWQHPETDARYAFRKTGVTTPPVRSFLRIDHVLKYLLQESENIGRYDFDRLRYDSVRGQITVLTNIPLRFEIHVAAFEVTIEIPSQRL